MASRNITDSSLQKAKEALREAEIAKQQKQQQQKQQQKNVNVKSGISRYL
ncbi:MAG: hypothetical protein PHY80_03785 [Rickettsiales bacterium]|nr:hypothetical protein [Rickettsiales bacterium]